MSLFLMDVSIVLFEFKEKAFRKVSVYPFVVIKDESWAHYLMLISASVSGLFL